MRGDKGSYFNFGNGIWLLNVGQKNNLDCACVLNEWNISLSHDVNICWMSKRKVKCLFCLSIAFSSKLSEIFESFWDRSTYYAYASYTALSSNRLYLLVHVWKIILTTIALRLFTKKKKDYNYDY